MTDVKRIPAWVHDQVAKADAEAAERRASHATSDHSSTDRRTFDRFMAQLPFSHREAALSKECAVDKERKMNMTIVRNLVLGKERRFFANMLQAGVASGTLLLADGSEHVPTEVTMDWPTIQKHAAMQGYINVIDLVRSIRADLAGKEHPYHCYLTHVAPTTKAVGGRVPKREKTESLLQHAKINPHRISRVWMLAVNEPADYEGGEVYFPTRESYVKLNAGDALIFWPTLPYGIAPVTAGVRRLLIGWATKHKRFEERE